MFWPYFAFLKILKIAVDLLKDMYSGRPKIGLKKFLVKTQKSAGLSKIYLVNSLSVCNELTSKSQTRAADFCFVTWKRLLIYFKVLGHTSNRKWRKNWFGVLLGSVAEPWKTLKMGKIPIFRGAVWHPKWTPDFFSMIFC